MGGLAKITDVATVIHAAGHISFCLFGTYPYALSPSLYLALRLSDAALHLLIYARDGDPIHLGLYASHVLKGNVPFIRANVYLNSVDALSYMYTASKIKDTGLFIVGCAGYVYMKVRGWIW